MAEAETPFLLSEYLAGASLSQLARKYGVGVSKIHRWLDGDDPDRERVSVSRSNRALRQQERVEAIASAAGRSFFLKPGAIWTDSRQREISRARHAAFLVATEQGVSSTAIGRAFDMDHSTVVYGRQQALKHAAADADFSSALRQIRAVSHA